MRRAAISTLLTLVFAGHSWSQDIVEPKSGTHFAPKSGAMSLLGVGLRTKTFLKVKVYAVGLYVADSALAGPLSAYKSPNSALFKDLVWGDFEKEVVLKFLRGVSTSQIQGAFREVLTSADKSRVDTFVSFFGDTKEGEEYHLHWAPGGTLETTVAGQARAAIADKTFASQVFGIWLGDKPVQEDIKAGLVAKVGAR
jgi:hypothetical protein